MNELHSMSVRDLIEALAAAEDATRRARRSAALAGTGPTDELILSTAREDEIVAEIRRRTAVPGYHDPVSGRWLRAAFAPTVPA